MHRSSEQDQDWTWNYKGCSFVGESSWANLKNKTNDEIRSNLFASKFNIENFAESETWTKVKKANIHYSKNPHEKVQLFDMPIKLTLKMDKKSGEVTQTKQLVNDEGWCAGVKIDQLGTENVLVYCAGSNLLMTDMMTWSGNLAIHLSETLEQALEDDSDIEETIFSKGFRYIGSDLDQDNECMVRNYEIRILNLGGHPLQFSIPEHVFNIVNKPFDNFCSVEDCSCCESLGDISDEMYFRKSIRGESGLICPCEFVHPRGVTRPNAIPADLWDRIPQNFQHDIAAVIGELESRIADLEARLNLTSVNSSLSPSAD